MKQIGRYRILEEVGRGAMGIVYRAQDPAIGRTVAVKTIRLNELVDKGERAKLRDRLFREAQSAGMLSHPGIVTIYDIAEEGDMAYVTMEFVDGPTLDRMLVNDPPDGKLVLSILRQTAAALDYAHKRGIVHRDIKPANIMIHEHTTAKITDFGVARIQSHQLTQAGSMVGTPNYMSPEQIQGQPVTGAADQFSLGVIAYEMLTGEKPFTAESMPSLVFKVVHDDPAPVERLNSTLGWTVDTVLKRALAKDPADRYPTCSDFIFALENACRSCKGWQPIAPGALLNLPTLAATPEPPAPDRAPPPPSPPPLPEIAPGEMRNEPKPAPVFADQRIPFDVEEPEHTPAYLRIARVLAIVVLAGGLISALLVAALQYFSYQDDLPANVQDLTKSPESKADPLESQAGRPEPSPARPAELPAREPDSEASNPEEPNPELPNPPPIQGAAATRLTTNPAGAHIVADGRSELSCVSPCTLSLSPGRHTLAVTKEGYRRALRIFQSPADGDIFVNLDRTTGRLVIRTKPDGVSVSIDGQPPSQKTPATLTLPTGPHRIELIRDGSRETHEVVIRDGSITNLTVDMSPAP